VLRAVWLLAIALGTFRADAKRLPIRTYTSADGLARDHVGCIAQDQRGFLWFCTPEGLSRFDGYGFTNYGKDQGLPGDYVTDFIQTRRGDYWVGTNGGLVRFDPSARGGVRFERVPLVGPYGRSAPTGFYEDRQGGVWCVGGHGVLFYRGPRDTTFGAFDFHVTESEMGALLEDRRGAFWMGTPEGLYRREPDGKIIAYPLGRPNPRPFIIALTEDHQGRVWVGTRDGLIRLDNPASLSSEMQVYGMRDGLPGNRIEAVLEASDRTIWVSTANGLAQWTPDQKHEGREFQSFSVAEGLSDYGLTALAEDRDGNLWIGTAGAGVMRVSRNGFVTYTRADGAEPPRAPMESRRGEICTIYKQPDQRLGIARFDGRRFTRIVPRWPARITNDGFWGDGQIAVQDRAGEWWFATGQGLCRFARTSSVEQLAGVRPQRVYTTLDGLLGDNIFRVYEDSCGDIWIGTIGPHSEDGLARWERATGRIRGFAQADGLPPKPVPTAFAEDHAGDLWVALYHNALARYRNGRFTSYGAADGVPGFLNSLYCDSQRRLWIASTRGLIRVDDPAAERPRFVMYGVSDGLSSHEIASITEDGFGRIYAVTGRGMDRFEATPGGLRRIRHYTAADGIPLGELRTCWRDRRGVVWFGTTQGIAQLTPGPDPSWPPPPVVVTGLSVGGAPRAISDLGETNLAGLKLPQQPLRIDFSGLSLVPGESLRYQYKLEGADRDWSTPSDQRTITYAHLGAGRHRFLVRAIASDGALSPEPAVVAFTILPPVWQTWWFLTCCAMGLSGVTFALHRRRVAHAVAVANVRTRIATDLHDDIGASLSQIAILSEVAQSGANGSRNGTPLKEIAGISRELVDSMSDIVWAINPEHDHLSNLVYRMRRFATDLLGGQGIALRFQSSVADHDLKIGADVRRQVYLIFKEAIHNAARHSGAKAVEVELERADFVLRLRVSDDGRGFDVGKKSPGHGLESMRARAAALRGTVDFQSCAQGTAITLAVVLDRSRGLSVLRGKRRGRFR